MTIQFIDQLEPEKTKYENLAVGDTFINEGYRHIKIDIEKPSGRGFVSVNLETGNHIRFRYDALVTPIDIKCTYKVSHDTR